MFKSGRLEMIPLILPSAFGAIESSSIANSNIRGERRDPWLVQERVSIGTLCVCRHWDDGGWGLSVIWYKGWSGCYIWIGWKWKRGRSSSPHWWPFWGLVIYSLLKFVPVSGCNICFVLFCFVCFVFFKLKKFLHTKFGVYLTLFCSFSRQSSNKHPVSTVIHEHLSCK